MTPPGIPPSTPTLRSKLVSTGTSGLISFGASTGAAFGLTISTGFGAAAWGGGGGGGGAGGGGGGATNAIMDGGVGRISVAISGMMTIMPRTTASSTIVRNTEYPCLFPNLTEGSTMSPNILSSRGTG